MEIHMQNQTSSPQIPGPGVPLPTSAIRPPDDRSTVGVGKSVVIKGDVTGAEDLTIDGQVDGRIDLRGHNLIIGPNGHLNAHVVAGSITILGTVVGNLMANEKVVIRNGGSVNGDIDAPNVAMADGAVLHGRIDTVSERKSQPDPDCRLTT
jgi:cytoskeletal protein CcmA (bactofilin family)